MMVARRRIRCIRMIICIMLVLAAAGCATGITREALLEQMQAGNPPMIVDVRSQGEYDRDHVPGAVHIPFYSIGSGLNALGYSKQSPIVLYCEHGPRSGIAGFTLFLSGYDQVYSLEGHMKGWRNNEFPLEIISSPRK
jgi:rhodanese-related sulfurtransferase